MTAIQKLLQDVATSEEKLFSRIEVLQMIQEAIPFEKSQRIEDYTKGHEDRETNIFTILDFIKSTNYSNL